MVEYNTGKSLPLANSRPILNQQQVTDQDEDEDGHDVDDDGEKEDGDENHNHIVYQFSNFTNYTHGNELVRATIGILI